MNTGPGGRIRPLQRRPLLRAFGAAGAGMMMSGGLPVARAADTRSGPGKPAIAQEIKTEFLHAWNGYKTFAFGRDQVMPLTGQPNDFFFQGHTVGLSIIEALDTLYVMELDDELRLCLDWIYANLSFDIDVDNFNIFEGIIRLVGGLLAGYLAVEDPRLLKLAQDLADRVLPAFTNSPTGMPYSGINLATGVVNGPSAVLAAIGSNILEFGTLSRLTDDPKYLNAAKTAQRAVFERRSSLDLLGTTIDIETGAWLDPTDNNINPPTDSFYEYLWGAYALLGDKDALSYYRTLNAALNKYVVETYGGLTWYKQVDFQTGALLGRGQSELASFWAELVSAGGDRKLGASYYKSWTTVLDRYQVLPEGIDYTTLDATSTANQFRPEYANSSFDLYWQTGHPIYEHTAYQYFDGLRTNARCPNGYTIINDVTTTPMTQGDLFPAYGFAENFKYLYLIFARTKRFDTTDHYLSTEGKILRGLRPDPNFSP